MPSVAVAASETLNTSDATHTANLPRIFFGDRIAALAHKVSSAPKPSLPVIVLLV